MEYKVSDIADINTNSIKKDNMPEIIYYLDTANITDGKVNNVVKYIPNEDKVPSRARRKIKENDILISTVRPNQRHYGFIDKSLANLIVSTGFAVLSPHTDRVDPYYLYLVLTSSSFTQTLQNIAEDSTSAYPSIKPSVIGDQILNLPSTKVQKRISSFVKSIDSKISLNLSTIANLEELSQTIFKRWFIDFEFTDENGNPYKSSGGEFKIVEGEAIPRTWKKEKLGNIITITSGKRPITKSNVKNSKYKYPIIGASKVMGFTNEYKYEDRRFIIGRVGTHGIIQEFNERIWPSDNTFVIKTEYWNYVKNILLDIDYNALNRGSTQPLITQTDLKNTQILVPDNLNKISDFEKFFEAQSSKIFTLKKEITYLESLRNTLLPKLMSGEIELPEDLEV